MGPRSRQMAVDKPRGRLTVATGAAGARRDDTPVRHGPTLRDPSPTVPYDPPPRPP